MIKGWANRLGQNEVKVGHALVDRIKVSTRDIISSLHLFELKPDTRTKSKLRMDAPFSFLSPSDQGLFVEPT